MSGVLAQRPPGCLAFTPLPPDGPLLLELAAHAGSWLSFHPAARFTGPPCRPDWRFLPPEALFDRERPDARSDFYSLSVTLLVLRQGPSSPVPEVGTVPYAQWALDDGAARAWDAEAGVDAPVRALFAACAACSRKRRPADGDALRAALLGAWPAETVDDFPVFRLRPPRLTRAAWLAAARALPRWQLAGLGLALAALAALLALYHR